MRTTLTLALLTLAACAEDAKLDTADFGDPASATSEPTDPATLPDETTGTTTTGTATGGTTGTTTGTGSTTGTGTGSTAATGTGTGVGTTTTTPVLAPDRTGVYVGTLDVDYMFTNIIGAQTFDSCNGTVTFDVDPTLSPAVVGTITCDLSDIDLSTATVMTFVGDIPADPDATGTMEVNDVVSFAGPWNAIFDLDNLSGGFSGQESFIGGDLTWQGTFSADR